MAIESSISKALGWWLHERKNFDYTVVDDAGDAVDLTGLALEWRLLTSRAASPALIEKTTGAGISVVGASNNIARVQIEVADYGDIRAGTYYCELWDRDADLLLSYGDVVLQQASAE